MKKTRKTEKFLTDLKRMTRRECATLLKVHVRSVGNFLKDESPIPRNKDGTFNAVQVVAWWVARQFEKSTKPAAESQEAIRWLEKYRRERFRLSRIERRLREGEVVAWAEVEPAWQARVQVVTSGLEAFADRLAALLVNRSRDEAHALLRAEVRELRDQYARNGRYTPEVITDGQAQS